MATAAILPHKPQNNKFQNTKSELLSRRYEQLFNSEKYYDCAFHICGKDFRCHKLILATASPVFEAMFYGPLHEQQNEIEILDISSEVFQILLQYIYTGTIDYATLSLPQIIELYYSAEKYLLTELKSDCLQAATLKLRFDNILPALELCVHMHLDGLTTVCRLFFRRCCLQDAQFRRQLQKHYIHLSEECRKVLCESLDQLQSQELLAELPALPVRTCLRKYFKACTPFSVEENWDECKVQIQSDRFIRILGLIMHSRLTPSTLEFNQGLFGNLCLLAYEEVLSIEISILNNNLAQSDGESDQEEISLPQVIWRQNMASCGVRINYNCDWTLNLEEGILLTPDVKYEITLRWPESTYGAEYPCSLYSNSVDGIQFKDCGINNGSLIKGLRFTDIIN